MTSRHGFALTRTVWLPANGTTRLVFELPCDALVQQVRTLGPPLAAIVQRIQLPPAARRSLGYVAFVPRGATLAVELTNPWGGPVRVTVVVSGLELHRATG